MFLVAIIVDPTAQVYSFEAPADRKEVVGTPTPATNSMPRQRLRSITLKKRACKLPNGSERMWREHADVGSESKVCLIPPGWCLSTRPRSAQTWRGSGGVLRGATG